MIDVFKFYALPFKLRKIGSDNFPSSFFVTYFIAILPVWLVEQYCFIFIENINVEYSILYLLGNLLLDFAVLFSIYFFTSKNSKDYFPKSLSLVFSTQFYVRLILVILTVLLAQDFENLFRIIRLCVLIIMIFLLFKNILKMSIAESLLKTFLTSLVALFGMGFGIRILAYLLVRIKEIVLPIF